MQLTAARVLGIVTGLLMMAAGGAGLYWAIWGVW